MNASLPRWFELFLGVAEVLAAVGLTLPGVTHVKPWLVSWAAAGIMIVMVSATILNVVRNEISSAVITPVLLGMAISQPSPQDRDDFVSTDKGLRYRHAHELERRVAGLCELLLHRRRLLGCEQPVLAKRWR